MGGTEAPPDTGGADLEEQVLRSLAPLASLGLVALVLGRVLGPALRSAGVGMGWLVDGIRLAGDVASQVFTVAAMVLAVVAVVAAARSRLPLGVRIAALSLGGLAIVPTVWALHDHVPGLSAAMVGASASLLALAAVPTLLRAPFARAPGLVIGLIAAGGLLRLVAVELAFLSSTWRGLASAAVAVATAAFACDTLAVAVAVVWVASRGKKLTSPATIVILAAALLCTHLARAGEHDDAHLSEVIAFRAAERLTTLPPAAVSSVLRTFVAFLAPMVAATALLSRGVLAPLGAAVALALAARGAVEMSPCALMLLLGALGAALTAHEGRGMWAALGRSGGAGPAHPGARPGAGPDAR